MEKSAKTDTFWARAKESGASLGDDYWVRRIGATKETVDIILPLVLGGHKRGSFGLKPLLDRQPGPGPMVGADAVVIDMDGEPHAIVRTTQFTPVPYKDIVEEHLVVEGPGARKLERWQEIHWPYWTKLLEPYDFEPSPDMAVMVEHFDLVFPQTV